MSILDNFKNPWANNYNSNSPLDDVLHNNSNQSDLDNVLNTLALQTDVLGESKESNSELEYEKDYVIDKLLISYQNQSNPFQGGDDFETGFGDDNFPPNNKLLKDTINFFKLKWREELKVDTNDKIPDSFLFEKLYDVLIKAAKYTDDNKTIQMNSGIVEDGYDYDGALETNEDVINMLINRMQSNSNAYYAFPKIIQDAAFNTKYLKEHCQKIVDNFKSTINYEKGNIKNIKLNSDKLLRGNNSNITLPYLNFNTTHNLVLNAVIGGFQKLEVTLKQIKFFQKKEKTILENFFNLTSYSFILEIAYYDDFGINASDITKPTSIINGSAIDGLVAFWILQHQRGYKPINTTIKKIINETGFF